MSHENSMHIDRSELASEYGQYVESKTRNGAMKLFFKALIIPFIVILLVLTGAAFAVANYSPDIYTQVKDNIFEKVDFEKLTGRPDSMNKEYLDSLLILNSDKLPVEESAEQDAVQEEQMEGQVIR